MFSWFKRKPPIPEKVWCEDCSNHYAVCIASSIPHHCCQIGFKDDPISKSIPTFDNLRCEIKNSDNYCKEFKQKTYLTWD